MSGIFVMLVFTSVLQLAGSVATRQKEIDTEIKRQKAICDEIKNTKPKLDRIKDLYTKIINTHQVTEENDKLISELNDDVAAFNVQIDNLRKAGRQKLLILLVINIVVVAFLSVYIVM